MMHSPSAIKPLVSILIPVYNHASYIQEALDSVFNDPYEPLELIVIDDGSTDSSWKIVQDWVSQHEGRFVRVVMQTQANQGICKTCNRLIALSEGAYTALLGSDDSLVPGGLDARVYYLIAHPEYLAVFGCAKLIGDNQKSIKKMTKSLARCRIGWLNPKWLVRELLLRWSLPGPVLMCRKKTYDTYEGVGLYDETLPFEDLEFYLRLLARNALGFVDQPVANYRTHASNASGDSTVRISVNDSDYYRIYTKNVVNFKGLNKLILVLKIWRQSPEKHHWKRPHHALARQALSIIKKIHIFHISVANFFAQ